MFRNDDQRSGSIEGGIQAIKIRDQFHVIQEADIIFWKSLITFWNRLLDVSSLSRWLWSIAVTLVLILSAPNESGLFR